MGEKMSTNLKYQLVEHTAGQAVQTYWAGKTFQGHKTFNQWIGQQ